MNAFFFLILFFISQSYATPKTYSAKEKVVQSSQTWNDFQKAMDALKAEDDRRGTSFIISGTLVTIGSLLAIPTTQDAATKLVYGVGSSAGIAAITYGIENIYYGHSYTSFYETLKRSDLSDSQRSGLVKTFMTLEQERLERMQRMQMWAHFFAAAMNGYSASIENDTNAKTFFAALAGLNLALGLSFSF